MAGALREAEAPEVWRAMSPGASARRSAAATQVRFSLAPETGGRACGSTPATRTSRGGRPRNSAKTDLGRIGVLWLNGRSGCARERRSARGGPVCARRGDFTRVINGDRSGSCAPGTKLLPGTKRDPRRGWGSLFHHKEHKGSPAAGRRGWEPWNGTRTLGRDSNTGTGLEHWDGTRTLGRD